MKLVIMEFCPFFLLIGFLLGPDIFPNTLFWNILICEEISCF